MNRCLTLLLAGVCFSANAGHDNGEFIVVDTEPHSEISMFYGNSQPIDRLQILHEKLDNTKQPRIARYNWNIMSDDEIRQSVLEPIDEHGELIVRPELLTSIDMQRAEKYIKKRNLAKKTDAKIGMTKNQVRNHTNWGEPNSINKTITAQGTFEQWVYDDFQYLYFKNDKLTTVQQNKSH